LWATTWVDEDPAVEAGFFSNEVHPILLPSLEALRVKF
jgi:hypothetical protein